MDFWRSTHHMFQFFERLLQSQNGPVSSHEQSHLMFVASLRGKARERKITRSNLERIPRDDTFYATTPVNPVDINCRLTLDSSVLQELLDTMCLARKQDKVRVLELLSDLSIISLHAQT
jgi:hypothetical protein